jgi:hypothetical protein
MTIEREAPTSTPLIQEDESRTSGPAGEALCIHSSPSGPISFDPCLAATQGQIICTDSPDTAGLGYTYALLPVCLPV